MKKGMKLNKYFMLGLAGLAFAACSNEDGLPGNGEDGSAKSLVISISGINSSAGTKASASDMAPGWVGDETGQGSGNINSLTLLFADGTGVVKYSYQADKSSTNTSEFSALLDNGVKFVGLEGVTAVYAVANKNADITVTSIKNISDLSTTLAKQGIDLAGKGSVVYAGGTTDITPLKPDDTSVTTVVDISNQESTSVTPEPYSYTANIHLVPVISRIQIKSIKVHSSGSVTFPSSAVGNISANSLKLAWSNFKPTLYGVYLNNFRNKFNDLLGTTEVDPAAAATNGYLYNESYANKMANGQWIFGTDTDMADDAAYIGYNSNNYTALAQWNTESAGYCTLNMGQSGEEGSKKDNCIAFNIFVPFEIAGGKTVTAKEVENPKIHFQFDDAIGEASNAYKIVFTDAEGNALTAEEEDFANSSELNINYTMPQANGYLFANIGKLYSEDEENEGTASTNELVLAPGKIYNMDVTIEPVNMTVDLETPTSYNVIVKITVEDFEVENIYPGFE